MVCSSVVSAVGFGHLGTWFVLSLLFATPFRFDNDTADHVFDEAFLKIHFVCVPFLRFVLFECAPRQNGECLLFLKFFFLSQRFFILEIYDMKFAFWPATFIHVQMESAGGNAFARWTFFFLFFVDKMIGIYSQYFYSHQNKMFYLFRISILKTLFPFRIITTPTSITKPVCCALTRTHLGGSLFVCHGGCAHADRQGNVKAGLIVMRWPRIFGSSADPFGS